MRRSRPRDLLATVTGLLLLMACGGDDAAGPDSTDGSGSTVTRTASPTTIPAPTGIGSPTGTGSPTPPGSPPTPAATSPDGAVDGTGQTFVVAPQEPRHVAVGSQARFSVGATYDGGDVPDRLWLGVVPCGRYDRETQTFTGTDGTVQGFDEDLGPRVYDVNGERYENVDDVWPTEVHVQDGLLTFSVRSERNACAFPTVFQDVDDDGELDVDDDGIPVEPYGIGEATWS